MVLNEYQKNYEESLSLVKVAFRNAQSLNAEAHVDWLREVQTLINRDVADMHEIHSL